MTTGGRSTPSMRGIEKPHTSASTTATLRPRWARATARLAVIDDLPTPPLPDATSRQRVRLAGSAKGMARPSAWPWAAWVPAVAAGSPCSFWRSSAALLVGHDREVDADPVDAGEVRHGAADPLVDLVAQRTAGDGEGDLHVDRAAVDRRCGGTMSSSTMLRCSSGSWTGRRASRTAASVTGIAQGLLAGKAWCAGGGGGAGQGRGGAVRGISPTWIGRIPPWPDHP